MAISPHSEIIRLRTALRDLVALSTIPAAWVGREPPDIAAGLGDVLVGTLYLDFAFVRLCAPNGGATVEVTRGDAWKVFPEWLQQHVAIVGQFARVEIVPDVGGDKRCRGILIPIGVNAEGGLVAVASRRNDFPTEIDQLLLSVAANQAAIAYQNARLIHERRSAEEALRISEARFRGTFENAAVGMAHTTLDGRLLRVNDKLCQITGYSREELLARRYQEITHSEDVTAVEELARRMMADEFPTYCCENRYIRKDGSIVFVNLSVSVLRDIAGKPLHFITIVEDITARKQAERDLLQAHNDLELKVAERTAELRQSEANLAEAQRLSRTGSFGWNVSNGEIYWSEELFRIFGCDPANKPTVQLILQRTHPEDRALVQHVIDRAAQEGKNFDFEHRLLMPDGSVKHLQVVGHTLEKDESGNVEFVGSTMDITERKRAEEQLREAHAELAHVTRVMTMGELLASIAHEINQPLTAVVTNAGACLRWLASEPPNLDEAREAARRAIRDGNRADEVITRIRALMRKTDTEKKRLDLNEVIEEVILLARNETKRIGVTVRMELDTDLPPVFGDRVQLQQLTLNLLMNGVESMAAVNDRPRELLVCSSHDESGQVLVALQDRGIGIDRENVERVFDAFYTTKSQGMGMGLTISRSIVEAHGGRLWATDNNDCGATFRFSLPSAVGLQE